MTRHTVGDIDAPPLLTQPAGRTVGDVLSVMFDRGVSQVGIEQNDKMVGIVTYRSICRALLMCDRMDQEGSLLDQPVDFAIERSYPVVSPTDDLFLLFEELAESPYVVIESPDGTHRVLRDVGFHQFLKEEIEEFLIIEEIERITRDLFRAEFEDSLGEELQQTFEKMDIRTPKTVEECGFRHYQIFISTHWEAFEPRFDQHQDFIRDLYDEIGDIRNRMFHFRGEDEADSIDIDFLTFAREYLRHTTQQ